MLQKIVSGEQTGVDQAALRAARAACIATGGWAPRGWLTEAGPAPWLADWGLVECPEPGYAARRRRNVADCDAALLFGDPTTPGSRGLDRDCLELGKHPSLSHLRITFDELLQIRAGKNAGGATHSAGPPLASYLAQKSEVGMMPHSRDCVNTAEK
jgi:hypothetical protein